ncbi:alpha/beta hydrolase [Pontibacter sp. G13]|uniref:alpha/beta hydrolase n=1 Tax=Pontibacter sp. G13 TaxID=3074898 RepID=UPI00288B3EBD|nr:alpha/beta hydrolase [Pontibacter sp. G13]WNJ16472.1 lysophospholipase [Pontibacter sp. G13]
MALELFSFSSNDQSFQGYHWPLRSPKAVLIIIHGHGEHAGRYAHVAGHVRAAGFATLAMDHYGHGKTDSKRGHIPSYDAVLDSIDALIAKARKAYPEIPFVLMGHSMGGNFVANYALQRKPDLAGVYLSAPWLRLAFEPSIVDKVLAQVGQFLLPSLTQPSKLDATKVSRDPIEVQKYVEDPLVHDMISPTLFMGCQRQGEWAIEHASEFAYPLLVMHGSGDQIASYDAAKEFAEKAQAGSAEVIFRGWEGYFHELHNEPMEDRLLVLDALEAWLTHTIEQVDRV